MPTPLSPSEQAAQAMLLMHGKEPIEALNVLATTSSAINALYDNDPDPSAQDINEATLTAIQSLGYVVTDLDHISRQYDYLRDQHAGFWSGNYTLVDSHNDIHSLLVTSDTVRLLLNGTDEVVNVPSEGGPFKGRTLTVDNDRVTAQLTFSTTADDVDLTADDTDIAAVASRFEIRVSGALTVRADGVGKRQVKGKRGVSTPIGVLHDTGEEPPWIWAGEYQLRYTDTALWEPYDGTLKIAYDAPKKALSVQLGSLPGTGVFYQNSVLGFRVELTKGVATQVTMEMHATSGGSRKCYVWFETTGQIRTLTGYATALLDRAALWNDPGAAAVAPPRMRDRVRAFAALAGPSQVVDFCRTPYDSVFSISGVVAAQSDQGAKAPSALFTGNTIKVKTGNIIADVTGYRVDEVGGDGNSTGRVAIFTYTPPTTETRYFPAGAKLRAYQQPDEAGLPQPGSGNSIVGVLDDKAYELPGLVETDFYEVRMSLSDYSKLDAAGLTITLAADDARQPGLIVLAQPQAGTSCTYDPIAGSGPDPGLTIDYTKASVLVRGATGETQNVGHKTYYFALRPRSASPSFFFNVTRTIYKPSGDPDGSFVLDGGAAQVPVPILIRVPIQMDSRDALELAGTTWSPAARGKQYAASVSAMKGQQPFIWRLLKDDKPGGLTWSANFDGTKDISKPGLVTLTLSGVVDSGTDPGSTFQPIVRVMSDKSCVMKPALASPQITVTEPETEGKLAVEVSNVASTVAAAIAAIGSIIMGIVIYKKQTAREKKKDAADDGLKLHDLSGDSLGKISKQFGDLARAVKEIGKKKDYLKDLDDKLEEYKDLMPKLEKSAERLKEQISRGGKDVAALESRLEEIEDEIRNREKEASESKQTKNKEEEKEEARGGD